MNIWISDILRSWRASLRRPGFVLLSGFTLALGLGLSTAAMALLTTLLAPLPFQQPDRIVVVGPTSSQNHFASMPSDWYRQVLSADVFQDTGVNVGYGNDVNVASEGRPEVVKALKASEGYLDTLGVRMASGRNFNQSEDSPNGVPAVIISHGFWQSRYAGRAGVIGQVLKVDGEARTIVGVLPDSFRTWLPLSLLLPAQLPHADDHTGALVVYGRLRAGISVDSASAQIDSRMRGWLAEHGSVQERNIHFSATLLKDNMVGGYVTQLKIIVACTLALLLLAGVNASNLMLLRTVSHSHAQAIRSALGASTLRTVLPLLGEGLLVALFGILAGLELARLILFWANSHLMRPEWFGTVTHAQLSLPSVAFGVLSGVLVIGLAALLGAMRARGSSAAAELISGGRSGQTVSSGKLSHILVVTQSALATLLLVLALLFAQTELAISNAPLGMDATHVVTAVLKPPVSLYPDRQSVGLLIQRGRERLQATGGVDAVGEMSAPSISFDDSTPLQLPDGTSFSAQYRAVSPDLFKAIGIPLVRGRAIEADDTDGAPAVAVVNQTFQERFLAGNAMNKSVTLALRAQGIENQSLRIVGVVGDVALWGPGIPAPPTIYVAHSQMPPALFTAERKYADTYFYARTTGNPDDHVATVKSILQEVAPELAVRDVQPLEQQISKVFAPSRVMAQIINAVAAMALILASVGLYAVVGVAVTARRREWAIRAALGASPTALLLRVVRGGLMETGIGMVIGLMLALGASSVVRSFQVDAKVLSFTTLSALVGVLLLAGFLACLVPGLRAGRTAPAVALQGE